MLTIIHSAITKGFSVYTGLTKSLSSGPLNFQLDDDDNNTNNLKILVEEYHLVVIAGCCCCEPNLIL